ncbi:hypothetical protein AsAng_0014240 [Aureispira anguillae]|uniref:Uncharacterized protein n=1 Tax=Aureispira anguillae TaxID=2864201 RepID=A0A915YCT0_9BACT|nr:hypothetical protein AsAng_0014240 [Aureispira anguillae]
MNEWQVVLYPNPTDKELTIESNLLLEEIITIEIYSTIGQ